MATTTKKDARNQRTGMNAVVFVVAVVLALVFVNILGARFFGRIDLTKEKVYTLSPASKEVVAKLPDRLTVKAFISGTLQPPFDQTAQYVRDMLDEYATASKGKLAWEVVNPDGNKELEEEAAKFKVPKKQRGRVSSGGDVNIAASYLGIAFQYQGNIEAIPQVNSPEGLEYQVTTLIKMMTQKKKKLAFATSEGEWSTAGNPNPHTGEGGGGLTLVKQYMQDYEVVPVDLKQGPKPIPDDVDALVLAGPKSAASERAKFVIDQFLMKGKSVAIFVDGMVVENPRGMMMPGQETPKIGRKNDHGLDDLLEHYGLKVRDDLVLEPQQNVRGPVQVGADLLAINHPVFVAATEMEKKHSLTDHLQGVVLPYVSSVEQVPGKQPGATFTALIRSTKNAWRQSGFYLFEPDVRKIKVGDDRGPFTLAWAAEGKFTSFFKGKPHPNDKGENVPPPDANTSLPAGPNGEETKPLEDSAAPGRLVVVGDSDFASDDYLRLPQMGLPQYINNLLLFMSVVDNLASDPGLIQVRAKGMVSRPMTIGSESTPSLVKWANVVGVPLAFIVFGVARWRVRTARRKTAKL